jgi:hypothetical protein
VAGAAKSACANNPSWIIQTIFHPSHWLPFRGIPAVFAERIRLAKEAGIRIIDVVKKDLRPSKILTQKAFENAITVDMAFGGSTNTTLHLPAISREAGIRISLQAFNKISDRTPHLCNMAPGGPHHLDQLHAGELQKLDGHLQLRGPWSTAKSFFGFVLTPAWSSYTDDFKLYNPKVDYKVNFSPK